MRVQVLVQRHSLDSLQPHVIANRYFATFAVMEQINVHLVGFGFISLKREKRQSERTIFRFEEPRRIRCCSSGGWRRG